MQGTILICDDELEKREAIAATLKNLGYHCQGVASGDELLSMIQKPHAISLILLDLVMPDLDGLGVLSALKKLPITHPPVIAYHRAGASDMKALGFHSGARDILSYPFENMTLKIALKNQLELASLSRHIAHGNLTLEKRGKELDKLALSPHAIMIEGARGTQKSQYIAHILKHNERLGRVTFTLECANLTQNEISEKYHLAQNSFLILKNIEHLPTASQQKLLELISEDGVKKNTRLIVTTNICLLEMTKKGGFREDLYYRLHLNAFKISPLSSRKRDIAPLLDTILRQFCLIEHKNISSYDHEVLAFLQQYPYSFHETELAQLVRRAVILCDDENLTLAHFKAQQPLTTASPSIIPQIEISQTEHFSLFEAGKMRHFNDIEQDIYTKALIYYKGNLSEMSRHLGVGRSTLYRKLEQYKVEA